MTGHSLKRPVLAVMQSNYIPWKGYFDLMAAADIFVLLDSVQYTKNDWRNRNRIKTAQGIKWLSIPVKTSGRFGQPICDVEVSKPWADAHWRTIRQAYGRAPFFSCYADRLEAAYEQAARLTHLSRINALFLDLFREFLQIPTPIERAEAFTLREEKSQRLLDLARALGARTYLSGPAAKAYLNHNLFEEESIAVHYMDYAGYLPYAQLHGPFDHHVSLLDLLFMTGPEARSYLLNPLQAKRKAPMTA